MNRTQATRQSGTPALRHSGTPALRNSVTSKLRNFETRTRNKLNKLLERKQSTPSSIKAAPRSQVFPVAMHFHEHV
eukprot:scaffold7028_cov243-Pinguiococcus_pyrenoidosus.AAC.4